MIIRIITVISVDRSLRFNVFILGNDICLGIGCISLFTRISSSLAFQLGLLGLLGYFILV